MVSFFFNVHPYLGKISNLTHIFQMGWFNHQLELGEKPGGLQLRLDKSLLSQLRAHQFPVWVEQLDVGEALDQLRICGAVGFAGQKDARIDLRNSSFFFPLLPG